MEETLMNNELSLNAKFENLASQQSKHLKIILEGALKEYDNLMWSKRKELLNRLEGKIDSLRSHSNLLNSKTNSIENKISSQESMIEIVEHEIKDFQKSLLQLQSNIDKITSSPAQKCLYNHQAEGKLNSLDQNVSDLNSKYYPLSQKMILLEEKFSSLSHDVSYNMDLGRFRKSFAQKLLNLECDFKTSQEELSSPSTKSQKKI